MAQTHTYVAALEQQTSQPVHNAAIPIAKDMSDLNSYFEKPKASIDVTHPRYIYNSVVGTYLLGLQERWQQFGFMDNIELVKQAILQNVSFKEVINEDDSDAETEYDVDVTTVPAVEMDKSAS